MKALPSSAIGDRVGMRALPSSAMSAHSKITALPAVAISTRANATRLSANARSARTPVSELRADARSAHANERRCGTRAASVSPNPEFGRGLHDRRTLLVQRVDRGEELLQGRGALLLRELLLVLGDRYEPEGGDRERETGRDEEAGEVALREVAARVLVNRAHFEPVEALVVRDRREEIDVPGVSARREEEEVRAMLGGALRHVEVGAFSLGG